MVFDCTPWRFHLGLTVAAYMQMHPKGIHQKGIVANRETHKSLGQLLLQRPCQLCHEGVKNSKFKTRILCWCQWTLIRYVGFGGAHPQMFQALGLAQLLPRLNTRQWDRYFARGQRPKLGGKNPSTGFTAFLLAGVVEARG